MDNMTELNPCGLNGFAFLEFSGPDQHALKKQFHNMGFCETANHTQQDITRYEQGNICLIVNAAKDCQAATHAKIHGPGACAMGFWVEDAEKAFNFAIKHGAKAFEDTGGVNHHLPGIEAIGGSVIYFSDASHPPFAKDWIPKNIAQTQKTPILTDIDHLTHNVFRGNMDKWAEFYESIFNFKEIRFFNIKGKMTGLVSRALASPCGKIKIPLNESTDNKSQIEEFLQDYKGEGIQHIALSTDNIYRSVRSLKESGVKFLDVPDTYYEMINKRIPWHQEPLKLLKEEKILIDGEHNPDIGLLLQVFTENIFGPVFFEIIQRQGNQGFGEGNFQALFEAIERDQIRRGTLESF